MITTALQELVSSALHAPASLFAPIGWENANGFALVPVALAAMGWMALIAGVALHRRSSLAPSRHSIAAASAASAAPPARRTPRLAHA
jgi:hypothetical protein